MKQISPTRKGTNKLKYGQKENIRIANINKIHIKNNSRLLIANYKHSTTTKTNITYVTSHTTINLEITLPLLIVINIDNTVTQSINRSNPLENHKDDQYISLLSKEYKNSFSMLRNIINDQTVTTSRLNSLG